MSKSGDASGHLIPRLVNCGEGFLEAMSRQQF